MLPSTDDLAPCGLAVGRRAPRWGLIASCLITLAHTQSKRGRPLIFRFACRTPVSVSPAPFFSVTAVRSPGRSVVTLSVVNFVGLHSKSFGCLDRFAYTVLSFGSFLRYGNQSLNMYCFRFRDLYHTDCGLS